MGDKSPKQKKRAETQKQRTKNDRKRQAAEAASAKKALGEKKP